MNMDGFRKCAFGHSWGTCGDNCICMGVRNSDMSPYATDSIAQYGDPIVRYVGDKQGHVTQIHLIILLYQIL
jgi:hypothetical protein